MLSKSFYDNLDFYKNSYQTETPFPHIVIDDFLKNSIYEKLQSEVNNFSKLSDASFTKNAYGIIDEHDNQKGKRQIDGIDFFYPTMKSLIEFLNGKFFLNIVEYITGFQKLESTPDYSNSGYHQTKKGGFLDVHHDFNVSHHDEKLFRQINFLLYLNEDWKSEWGGDLELWKKDMSGPEKIISPVANRVVIFNIDKAPHGHPHPLNCPDDEFRKSFALYYYNRVNPEFKEVSRAIWRQELSHLY